MKRRILCAFLTLAMLVSIVPSAFAAKKQSAGAAGSNIYADIGSFETKEQADKMNFSQASGTIVAGGYKGNCVKVEVLNDWGGMRFAFPAVIGETYEVSFWTKTDDAPATMSPIVYYDSGYNVNMFPSGRFENSWTKYSAIIDFDGTSNQGDVHPKAKEVDIRYGNGQQKATYYIDEMVIVAQGKVKDADYSSLELTGAKKATVKEDSANAPIDVVPVEFSDMNGHWAKETVNQLATYGYVNGMGNNVYSPDTNVTRAQFTKMMTDMFDIETPKYNASYSDIKGDEWYAPSVSLATAIGLIDPAMTFGNRFLPEQAITREEAASIAAKMAEYKEAEKKEETISFNDDADITAWAKTAVKDAASYGLIKGYADGTYKPQATITRAEAATILKRVAEFSTLFSLYVDAEKGNDKNEGTENAPLKTVFAAQKRVREVNKTMKNDIYVYIRGEHYLDKPLSFNVDDSGFNQYRVIYTSWGEEKAVFTAGKEYKGFQMHDEDKNIYKVFVGPVESRQVYFNDVRGIRARTVSGFSNPKFQAGSKFIYQTDDLSLANLAYPLEMEGVWHNNWRHDYIRFESVEETADGNVQLVLPSNFSGWRQSYWAECPDHRKYPTFLENAYEFLDEPSEWYLDSHAGYLYYIPREGEDMSTMVATIPMGERLLTVNGVDGKNPVRNLTFNNIEFSETGWNTPTTAGGLATNQNYSFNGGGVLMYSALHIKDAHYIDFTNNKITRIGSSGLQTSKSVQHCNFLGNEFTDISGGGMSLGAVVKTDLGTADPYLTDEPTEWNAWNNVKSNFFYGTGLQYKGCAVLSVGWPRHTRISYNYIGTSPYSGMHTGWGWGSYAAKGTNTYDFEISHNYYSENVNDRLYDGASIYMLASTSLEAKELENNNLLTRNYFENPRNAYGAVYPDEGSSYWHVTENVVNMSDVNDWLFNFHDLASYNKDTMYWGMLWAQTCKYNTIDENYVTLDKYRNASETNNIVNNHVYPDADWPEEAQKIIEEAYIEPEYLENFERRNGPLSMASRKREYVVAMGEEVPLDFKIYGNYMKEYDRKDFDIDYWVSDPELLTVDENGVMTAHGTGEVWVVANANINGFIQIKEFRILAGEKFEELNTSVETLNLLNGYSATITVDAITTFGNKETVDPSKIKFEIQDTNVATVDEKGIVKSHNVGNTVMKITATDKGFSIDKEVPITVISLSQPDSLELPYQNAPSSLFLPGAWTGTAKAKGNGVDVKGSPAYNLNIEDGKLYAFDMVINSTTGWPSLALCASERMGSYADSNTYMIGFKGDHIEFQRFNMGERTMIFGDSSFKPVGGPGIPNDVNAPIYKYGERMSVVVGALPHPKGGTRIVLTINGTNVFDYHDNDPKACTPNGLFGVYDNFEFYPYTGPELGAAE